MSRRTRSKVAYFASYRASQACHHSHETHRCPLSFSATGSSSRIHLLKYISTKEQAADGFTKPLASIMFKRFVSQLGLAPIN
ncbi:Reverse transcriptase RNA-dependent DNA polymerase [Penicillium mononematosum]|uniref:Reverse transcriptase RNA-dependent DNA polymerase n=1 Tax=Penicillium mononematosum TaxID=268346 RepID=UPI002547318D|nr:Reverse transcriptase RNA-dependent DNA polymerase [Penicillium mononematosum]KAJ6179007.1 Reverse transcriptase RNA-dependent DNA polymerase [Penicillium mononematosum]